MFQMKFVGGFEPSFGYFLSRHLCLRCAVARQGVRVAQEPCVFHLVLTKAFSQALDLGRIRPLGQTCVSVGI